MACTCAGSGPIDCRSPVIGLSAGRTTAERLGSGPLPPVRAIDRGKVPLPRRFLFRLSQQTGDTSFKLASVTVKLEDGEPPKKWRPVAGNVWQATRGTPFETGGGSTTPH